MSTAKKARLEPRKAVGRVRSQKARRGRARVWLKRAGIALAALVIAGFATGVGVIWYYGRDLPTVDQLRSYQPPQTTRVVDRHGALLGEVFTERRTVVPMDRIPRVLVLSVLAAEDADFYRHEGLDYPGILRAISRDVLEGRPAQGASTITQQVVKLMLLTPERTVSRKMRELILARRLEQELEKDEILHLYLNHINFGHGRYGVQEAAQYYFGKNVEELTLAEASLIAGVPQAPGRLSPRTHPEAARRRQLYVLSQLEQKRAEYWPDLSAEDITAARETEVALVEREESGTIAPEIVVMVREALRERVGDEAFARGGYTVHTTIDARLQRETREALQKNLQALDGRHGYRAPIEAPRRRRRAPEQVEALRVGRTYVGIVTGADDETGVLELDVQGHPAVAHVPARYNPEALPPSQIAADGARIHVSILRLAEEGEENAVAEAAVELGPQGAAVVIDPRTRDVLAMVGGYEATAGFNRATQAERQPGSAFKPIVYALGLKARRFTPATIVVDAPAVYDQWKPTNYEEWRYEGQIRLRQALAKSVNLVAVRLIEDVSPQETVSFARQLGITNELDPSLALALGASEVKLDELVNAYATFAAGGRWEPTRIIQRIEGPDGRDVPLPEREPARDVLTPAEAYLITSMLTSVVQEGTASAAQRLRRPLAGKTGTSNEARDAWFVGYSPSVVAGVWIGFDDRRSLGRRESGTRSALPVWIDVMRAALEDAPVTDFPVPSGIVTAKIDPESGLLATEGAPNAVDEVFLEGTAPTEVARPPDVADPDTFLMEQFGTGGAEGGEANGE